MNTKTLLLLGVFGAAGLTSAVAQTNVYSVNAVGYVNKTIPTGFSLISNPLNAPTNTVNALIPNPPEGTVVFKFNNGTFSSSSFVFGQWNDPQSGPIGLAPGEGVFIQNVSGSTFNVTFVGDVMQGSLTNALPSGFSIRSSIVPQAGSISALGFPEIEGLTIFQNPASYTSASFFFGQWNPSVPTIAVGESFWVNNPGALANWTRSFSVNN